MSYIKLRKYILGVAVAMASTATAYTLDEAKEMYQAGDFAGALPVFEEALAINILFTRTLIHTRTRYQQTPHRAQTHNMPLYRK